MSSWWIENAVDGETSSNKTFLFVAHFMSGKPLCPALHENLTKLQIRIKLFRWHHLRMEDVLLSAPNIVYPPTTPRKQQMERFCCLIRRSPSCNPEALQKSSTPKRAALPSVEFLERRKTATQAEWSPLDVFSLELNTFLCLSIDA